MANQQGVDRPPVWIDSAAYLHKVGLKNMVFVDEKREVLESRRLGNHRGLFL